MKVLYSHDTNALRLFDNDQAVDSVAMHKNARNFTTKRRLGIARHVYPKAFENNASYVELKEGEGYGE